MRQDLGGFGSRLTHVLSFPTYWAIGRLLKTNRLQYQMQQEAFKVLCDRFGFKGKDVFSAGLYDTYNQWVRDEAAKRGKPVLEFQAEDGWKPLYNFLNKPSPPANVPFPHLNDQRTKLS